MAEKKSPKSDKKTPLSRKLSPSGGMGVKKVRESTGGN